MRKISNLQICTRLPSIIPHRSRWGGKREFLLAEGQGLPDEFFALKCEGEFVIPYLEEDINNPRYSRFWCPRCKDHTPKLHYDLLFVPDYILGKSNARFQEVFQKSLQSNTSWCICTSNKYGLMHYIEAEDPRPLFIEHECLQCLNDPRIGALTLINPMKGELTMLDSGALTLV